MNKARIFCTDVLLGLFALAGAVNDGISSFYLAIPFILLWLWLVHRSKNFIRKLFISTVLIVGLAFVLTRGVNPLLYPSLGEEIIFQKDIPVSRFGKSKIFNTPYSEDDSVLRFISEPANPEYLAESIVLPKGLYKIRKIVIKHPDFATTYSFELHGSEATKIFRVGGISKVSMVEGEGYKDVASPAIIELLKLTEDPEVELRKFQGLRPLFFRLSFLMTYPVLAMNL